MAPSLSARGKVKDVGEVKSEKPKVHWKTANKKLFLDLAIKEKYKGDRPSKAFNAVGWKNIIKEFNAKTGTPSGVLTDSIKAIIDILNNTEGIEMASPFWVNATEILENETKRTLWLRMPERVDSRG